jgi:hypothetical protein
MEYAYGMRLRGFSPWCHPMDGLVRREDDPTGKYYDILIYNRRLSTKEKENYELDEIRGEINGRRRYNHHAQE